MSVTFNITFTLKQDVIQFKQGTFVYLLGILCTDWPWKGLSPRNMYRCCTIIHKEGFICMILFMILNKLNRLI